MHPEGIRFATICRHRGWRGVRAVCLLLTLLTIAAHMPAALDTDDGSPAFAIAALAQARGHAPDADDLALFGCHHGHYHAHSLCAPPVIPVGQLAWFHGPTAAAVPPLAAILMRGRVERLRHPPPKPLV